MKNFERGRLHDTNIKTVILRLDYGGVVDSKQLNNLFDKRFPKAFKGRQEIHNNEFNIQLKPDELRSISRSLSVPVNVIEKETIIRYIGMRDVACDVTLDISQYYLCMAIQCKNNYDGLDKYLECFKGAITVFSEKVAYFQPKRLGIRKIRVEDKPQKEDFKDVFEDFVFNVPSYNLKDADNFKTEYFDFFEVPALNNIRFNVHRTMDKLEKQEDDGAKKITYQAVLDIDAYYRFDELVDINKLLTQANSEEYKVYLYCMKESYLRRIYQ